MSLNVELTKEMFHDIKQYLAQATITYLTSMDGISLNPKPFTEVKIGDIVFYKGGFFICRKINEELTSGRLSTIRHNNEFTALLPGELFYGHKLFTKFELPFPYQNAVIYGKDDEGPNSLVCNYSLPILGNVLNPF